MGRSSVVRHLTASASHSFMSFMRTTAARMISAACLLTRHQSLLLIGREESLALLHRLLADLARLLLPLLGRERGVGADALDLRMGLLRDGVNLFRDRFFNAGLLHAILLASAVNRPRLRGRIRGRRSALRQHRPCAKKKSERAKKFPHHDGDLRKVKPTAQYQVVTVV
jgi:hypothetical protein